MEHTPVIIVGAGPSGLALGLSLANHKIKSIILEKEIEITDDPRGVALSGDCVRVLWSLGIQDDQLSKIGHELKGVMFHKGSLKQEPFFKLDVGADWRHQVVPDSIMMIQPELERVMRQSIEASEYCQLWCGCEVVSIEQIDNDMRVEYRSRNEEITRLKGSWLVGADGKQGFVRKHYLEPIAGVHQEPGLYAYDGTWIAANLHIKLPTPETHPDLPAWVVGLTPQEVYDLFWPEHLHFVGPPGKPTATMRFGPAEARLWRHEFAEPDWHDSNDAEKMMWEHLSPTITRHSDGKGRRFNEFAFPRDCIEIKRCSPYTVSQKVVNKWFHRRAVLIGDAAHVFPPFGGQGIATGIKDAQALAWRLALFNHLPNLPESACDDILTAWSHERKQGVDDSARVTKANGNMTNKEETRMRAFLRRCAVAIESIPIMPHIPTELERAERDAYKPVSDGFFSSKLNGGGKIAQIYFRQNAEEPFLSDGFLKHDLSLMTLVILEDHDSRAVENILKKVDLPESVISTDSIVRLGFESEHQPNVFYACKPADLPGIRLREGYEVDTYRQRFGRGAKYAIIRPDFIVYSTARNLQELEQGFQSLKLHLGL